MASVNRLPFMAGNLDVSAELVVESTESTQ